MPVTPRQLKSLYDQGVNISAFLREEKGLNYNTEQIIETAYDLQAGSYIARAENPDVAKQLEKYTFDIAKIMLSLCQPQSILEAGVGEATTLSGVLKNLQIEVDSFGFDLSWSRVAYAKKWLQRQGISNVTLCTGSLLHIPFADNSIDIVYTSHSIEPNRGREEPILRELFRVTRKYLILLEPSYELASDEARQRMDFHGYCKGLKGIADSLGYHVLEHQLFPGAIVNPLNPTAITIIRKTTQDDLFPSYTLACPQFKTRLEESSNMLFSPEALMVYPIVAGIPCLRLENGIVASKYQELFMGTSIN